MSGDEKDNAQRDPGAEGAARDERDEREDPARARKERVLHTRVPAVLEEELKRLATSLRVPVSNVVRVILEDAVAAVDAVGQRAEGELKGIAERLAHQRDALRTSVITPEPRARGRAATKDAAEATTHECPREASAIDGVLGFQSLVLASDQACTVCGRALARGSEAARGVRDDGGPRVLLGARCRLLPASDVEGGSERGGER